MFDDLFWTCLLTRTTAERFERHLPASRIVLRDDKLAYVRDLQALVNTSDDFVSRRTQLDKERKAKMDERQKVCVVLRCAEVLLTSCSTRKLVTSLRHNAIFREQGKSTV